MHKITSSQSSTCHKITTIGEQFTGTEMLHCCLTTMNNPFLLNSVNENILEEISHGHHSPRYCTTRCPMMHCISISLLQTDGCSGTAR